MHYDGMSLLYVNSGSVINYNNIFFLVTDKFVIESQFLKTHNVEHIKYNKRELTVQEMNNCRTCRVCVRLYDGATISLSILDEVTIVERV